MKDYMVYFLDHYDKEIVKMIAKEYKIDFMEAFRKFLSSQTYQMLEDPDYEM